MWIKKKITFTKNAKGSLLLEALLSVVILSVSLTLIIQSMTASLRASVYGADYTLGTLILENKMFGLMTKGLPQPSETETIEFPFSANPYHFLAKARPAAGPKSKIKEVDIGLTWNSGKRKNNISLTTYLFDRTDTP